MKFVQFDLEGNQKFVEVEVWIFEVGGVEICQIYVFFVFVEFQGVFDFVVYVLNVVKYFGCYVVYNQFFFNDVIYVQVVFVYGFCVNIE